jgi:PKD repeat protein
MIKRNLPILLLLTGILISPVFALPTDFTVDFAANATGGTAPLTVQFYNLATGNLVNCTWVIDGDVIDECPGPVHTFQVPGNFDINLTITDDTNTTLTEIKTGYINVTPANSQASLSFIGRGLFGSNPVEITDKATGRIVYVGDTSSKNITLPDGFYKVQIEPGSLIDFANSPDYGLTAAAQTARKNVIGIFIGGTLLLAILGYFWRR